MRRFVVVATARRGSLPEFEAVCEETEMRLNESMRLEVFGEQVVWRRGFSVMSESETRVARMIRLARRVG